MNMQVLKKSRQRPEPGDIFVYRMQDRDYGFGRVIRTDAQMESWHELLLVYIYEAFSESEFDIPPLRKNKLLIPPTLVSDNAPWTCGYFKTVARERLMPLDVLEIHCFRSETKACYVDEFGRILPRRTAPCGLYAVGNEYALDAEISMALGIELSPDEEEDDQVFEWPKVPKSVRNAPPSPAMQSLLETLLGELEEVGQTHEEVYDTIVREELSQAILRAFVLSQDEYSLPKKFAMNSAKGNRAVRAALDRYIKAAKREAVKLGLDTPPKRSAAFEDVTVETDEGQTFDSFFGASE